MNNCVGVSFDKSILPKCLVDDETCPLVSSPIISSSSIRNNNTSCNGEEEVSIIENSCGSVIINPRIISTKSNYGSIAIGINRSSIEGDDDLSDDDDGSGGFPSEAGWSARLRRSRRISLDKSESNSYCLQYLGLIFTMLYAIFTSLSGLTVKLLEKEYHAFNICFWRFTSIFLISITIILYTKIFTKRKLWPRSLLEQRHEHLTNVLLLFLRGILGCAGRILYIFSITCLSLSDANVIASSSPVFMTFFAYFLLGENCGIVPVLIAFVTLIGVGIITRPPWLTGSGSYDSNILLGTGTGIGGMILTTLVMVVMRRLRHVNVTLITLSFASCGAVSALILSLETGVFVWPTQNLRDVLLLIASGATSFLGQTFLTLGLKYENAGVVALLTNFSVVFSFIFEFIFLHISPDLYSVSGGFLVVFCIVLTTFRKWIGALPQFNSLRIRFSFFLI